MNQKYMTKKLYNWLKEEWKTSNHKKYQKYFEEWVSNLTESQILGFNKMRTANYITNNLSK